MLFALLLASQFWLMSDRASFWDPDKISDQTAFMLVSNPNKTALDSKEMKGKNVLLLVHGYNNNPEQALATYRLVNLHVSAFKGNHPSQFYDIVIGYLWPGDDFSLAYYDAERHVSKLAMTMRSHLEFLAGSAARLDALAHSMGNRLLLKALNYPSNGGKKVVHNFYSIAAAVDDESIEKNEEYYRSVQNCEKVFVFYSKHDGVLKWDYSLAERSAALGYEGAKDPKKLPLNVELINYTDFISQHSQYFMYSPIYDFIKAQFQPSKIQLPQKEAKIGLKERQNRQKL